MPDALMFGSLLLDNKAVPPGTAFTDGSQISFTDTISGCELSWVPIPGTKALAAKTTLLTNISWRQLRDLGFLDGKTFILDDQLYFIRLPWLGVAADKHNELASVPEESLFCWGHEMFIGFEDKKKPEQRSPIYGGPCHIWSSLHPAEKRGNLGFRPVLEPGLNN